MKNRNHRALIKLREEKDKWTHKSFEEIRGLDFSIQNTYIYEYGEGDELRHVELEIVNSAPDFLHLRIWVTDNKPTLKILGLIPVYSAVSDEWRVFKDGRVVND